jgi:hypothetical protein
MKFVLQDIFQTKCNWLKIKKMDYSNSFKNSYTSSCMKVGHSVPQGLVLGPLLFLLYINDITEIVQEAKLVLFVEDTSLLITGKDKYGLHKILNVVREALATVHFTLVHRVLSHATFIVQF